MMDTKAGRVAGIKRFKMEGYWDNRTNSGKTTS